MIHPRALGTELEPTWKEGTSASIVGSVNSIVLSANLRMCFRELSLAKESYIKKATRYFK